jgi:hypothetical protein
MISMAGGYTRTGSETIVHISIIALTWIFLPPYWDNNRGSMGAIGGGLHVLEPNVLFNTSTLLIFNIIFAPLLTDNKQIIKQVICNIRLFFPLFEDCKEVHGFRQLQYSGSQGSAGHRFA